MIHKFIQGFQEVLHILYNMFKMLILLECPCRAEVQSLSQILKVIIGMALWNILKTLLRVMIFFSEYCLDDENMSIQPEQINTPGISDLDTGFKRT